MKKIEVRQSDSLKNIFNQIKSNLQGKNLRVGQDSV